MPSKKLKHYKDKYGNLLILQRYCPKCNKSTEQDIIKRYLNENIEHKADVECSICKSKRSIYINWFV